MAYPPGVRKYVLTALAGTPDVLEKLLQGLASNDPIWDYRPEPQRFTLREILAHLADWDPIFRARLIRTVKEHEPALDDIDEGQVAIDRDYAHQDPIANLKRLRQGREATTAFLRGLNDEDWDRAATKPPIGRVTVESQVALIVGHDGYHTQQIAQWLTAAGR